MIPQIVVAKDQYGHLRIWSGDDAERYRQWFRFEIGSPPEPTIIIHAEELPLLVFTALQGPMGPPGPAA